MNRNDRASASREGPLTCPRCGAGMNRHAEKVDYGAEAPRLSADGVAFGGTLMEFHTCPGCRYVVEQPAGDGS